MKKIFLFIFLALSLVGCAKENSNNNLAYTTDKVNTTQSQITSTITPDVKIDQYQTNAGKNTFVGFVATWCPHCKDEIPVFDEFYRENKDNVNMVLFVQDKKKFEGDFIVPQEITNPLSYEQVTGETCGYVPSYVIFDSNKNIIDKKCGAKLSKQDLETKLLTKEIPMSELQSKGFENGDLGVVLTTSNGKIEIKMFPNEAPKTVLNFLGLVQKGYYNGIIFHRVINGFMIQGGDPTGTGMGGESLFGGEFEDEFNPNLGNFRGSLSMANAGANTNGSQFFINQVNNNGLDYVHSVFGQVITGMDNVDKIAKTKVGANDKPVKDVKIIKAEVVQFENGKLKTITYDYESKIKEIDDAKASLIAEKGDTVKVNYVLTDNDSGEEYDNSYKKGQAFPVVIGAEGTLLKFNESLEGMKIGDKKTIVLTPKEAYGELNNPEALKEFNKSEFYEFEKNGIKIEAGAKIPTQYGELKIAKVEGDKVTIDFTHPLAGKTLKFDIEMMNITKATK